MNKPTPFLILPGHPHPKLRCPRNRSAAMWYLLDLVSRGSRYHTRGEIRDPKKLTGFIEKMHAKYGVLLSRSGKRKRQLKGEPTAQLVMYQDWDGVWLWWLLVAGNKKTVKKLAEKHRENFKDATSKSGRLTFRDDYVLRWRQRPAKSGGGTAWTWYLDKRRHRELEKELVYLASARGQNNARNDPLIEAANRLRNRPMFGGVRMQARASLGRAEKVWKKTHRADQEPPAEITETLPWFASRMRVFD
jgi:hypothetical protein